MSYKDIGLVQSSISPGNEDPRNEAQPTPVSIITVHHCLRLCTRSRRPAPTSASPRHASHRLDHDGKFSVEEIAAASAGLIDLDTDHDGQLTSLESLPSQSDPAANKPDETVQRLMALDRNGDGTLTKDEVPDRLQGLFARSDSNHDDKLTPDEIRASAATQAGPNGRAQRSGEATRKTAVVSRWLHVYLSMASSPSPSCSSSP